MDYGLIFSGSCDNSFISQNNIKTHRYGFDVHDHAQKGIIGNQYATRNKWLDLTSYTDAARFLSTADIGSSLYFIKTAEASDPSINPSDVTMGWFIPEDIENTLCSDIRNVHITWNDSMAILGNSYFTNQPEPIRFYQEKNLIGMILDDATMNSTYSSYLTSRSSQSEFKIAKIEKAMKDALSMNLTDESDLDALLSNLSNTYSRYSSYDAYNYANIDSVTFTLGIGLDSMLAILEDCHDIIDDQKTIRSSRLTTLFADLDVILDSLSAISPRASFDGYYKQIYTLYIKAIQDGGLQNSDYVDLQEIADDDTDSSFANITAYALFQLCGGYLMPEFSQEKSQVRSSHISNAHQTYRSTVGLNDIVSDPTNSEFQLKIYDVSGRLIFSGNVSTFNNSREALSIFGAGVYPWTIYDQANKTLKSGFANSFK